MDLLTGNEIIKSIEESKLISTHVFIEQIETACEYIRDTERPWCNLPALYRNAVDGAAYYFNDRIKTSIFKHHGSPFARYFVHVEEKETKQSLPIYAYEKGTETTLPTNASGDRLTDKIIDNEGLYFVVKIYEKGIKVICSHESDDPYWNGQNAKRIYYFLLLPNPNKQ